LGADLDRHWPPADKQRLCGAVDGTDNELSRDDRNESSPIQQ